MRDGSATSRLLSSSWVARCHSDEPIALHVVSIPAIRTRAAVPMTTESSTCAPSTFVCSSSLMRSSPGSLRAALDLFQEVADKAPDSPFAAHRVVGELEDVADPIREGVRQVLGDPEDLCDDPDRDLLRVLLGGIGVTCRR